MPATRRAHPAAPRPHPDTPTLPSPPVLPPARDVPDVGHRRRFLHQIQHNRRCPSATLPTALPTTPHLQFAPDRLRVRLTPGCLCDTSTTTRPRTPHANSIPIPWLLVRQVLRRTCLYAPPPLYRTYTRGRIVPCSTCPLHHLHHATLFAGKRSALHLPHLHLQPDSPPRTVCTARFWYRDAAGRLPHLPLGLCTVWRKDELVPHTRRGQRGQTGNPLGASAFQYALTDWLPPVGLNISGTRGVYSMQTSTNTAHARCTPAVRRTTGR